MRRLSTLLLLAALSVACPAQTVKSRTVEDGGTGPYKALMVGDASCPDFTIYRPADLAAAARDRRLPIILYGNGGCANSTVEIRFFLNELASHGYLAIGIGPYDDEDSNEHWRETIYNIWPEEKGKIVLSNGQEVPPLSPAESLARIESYNRRLAEARRETERNPSSPAATFANATQARQLLEAMDWLTAQNSDPASEYYHKLDLDKVAAMGQSCGGAQALAIGHDPRVKTCVIMNSGIGDMTMQGFSAAGLANLHTPMFYLIGGPTDSAYKNSENDYQRIGDLPVVRINTHDGHLGTYYERHGGAYAVAVRKWLDWQLKGDTSNAAFFLTDEALGREHPDWSVERKNWVSSGAVTTRPTAMRRAMTPPEDPAYRIEQISVMSGGNKLVGEAFIPVAAGKHPAVILSHGYNSSSMTFYSLASKLAKEGYVCYCYDFAGGSTRSRSEGSTLQMSIFTERQNLTDVLDTVRSWSFVDKKNVFLLGESQGGCVSAITAPYVKKKINSIMLIYPALCIPDDALDLFPTVADIPDEFDMMNMKIGKAYYEPLVAGYDIYADIARYQGNVLIVHGTEDSLVKPEYSAKASNVYDHCEFHLIFGAGHGFHTPEFSELYHNYVVDFLKSHIK
ncbi:MAG: alpha/beta fold hydrolase [Bacteroidales bacterium]|nr:alpha/beta fold hydrolase [Bacteroidales bacterium]